MMSERRLYQLNESQMKLRTTFEGLEEAAQIPVRRDGDCLGMIIRSMKLKL